MKLAPGAFTVPILPSNPTETPDAGTAFLFMVGGSYRLKLSDGNVFTFAVGISPEEVQDIIGTFITPGSSRLSVSYNDVGNVLVLDVVPGQIAHQSLSGAGTNDHAAIDSHIGNTANPHATTAAQVGAFTTAQTQAALDLKYNASNPNGYETPAQLNARDTANRSRANHTGAQLASTISDFAATVRGTILAGFTVGANAAIDAADSVLGAFGKVQGQLNFIFSVLSTLVLGDQFEQFLDDTSFSTTSNANQVAASFTTANKQAGLYRIGVQWRWTNNTGTSDSIFGVYVDGVLQDAEYNLEQQDPTTIRPWGIFTYVTLTAGVHTIELRTRSETAGITTTVSHVRAEIWRANP